MNWEQATTELVRVSVDESIGLFKSIWISVSCFFRVLLSGNKKTTKK
jgi:hypothetical protein